MGKYIELDALIDEIRTARNQASLGKVAAAKLEKFVKNAPAANVAPVRHGRWDIKKHPPGLPEWAIRIMVQIADCRSHKYRITAPTAVLRWIWRIEIARERLYEHHRCVLKLREGSGGSWHEPEVLR